MDINKLTKEDIHTYTYSYLWADDINAAYPEAWELLEIDYTHDHHLCGCGCGDLPRNNHYMPGHDQKHYGKLLRRWQAADLAGRIALIREAQLSTTNGVWGKFMDRTGFDIIRGGVMGEWKYYVIRNAKTMVTKVGRWAYPVVADIETRTFYRSSTPIKDQFQAGHSFDTPVDYKQVGYLYQILEAQAEAELGVTA